MWRWVLVPVAATVALLSAQTSGGSSHAVVASIADGDTLTLTNGDRVRLLQIDAPEVGQRECYSQAARRALLALAPIGRRVTLEVDPELDLVDRFGRILRYVKRGRTNVNLELVRQGAAAPYFYRGEQGKYARQLLAAATAARARGHGLWGLRVRPRLNPNRQVDTGRCGPSSAPPVTLVPPLPPANGCDPNYAGACVPAYPPDLDCDDLRVLRLALPVRVVGADPHRLDGDRDGYGCE